MSDGEKAEQPEVTKKQKTMMEKQAEHISRIQRTLVACLLGMFTGVLSFYTVPVSEVSGINSYTMLAFLLMLAGIVIQKHIFMLTGTDVSKLGAKDWFYQSFMTFALWFMTWAILLSAGIPAAGFTANVTSGNAPLAIAFTDISSGSPTSWNWEFGDGSNATVKNPEHRYTKPGNFNVSLSVANPWGSNQQVRKDYINVTPAV